MSQPRRSFLLSSPTAVSVYPLFALAAVCHFPPLIFQIRVRTSVREVIAVYTVDDGSMELVILIPANFPLGAVKVESGKKVGVGNQTWRNWMLQLTTFLQVGGGIFARFL